MNPQTYFDQIDSAKAYIQKFSNVSSINWSITLGSGLGGVYEKLEKIDAKIPFESIPGFPGTTITGHSGELIIGHYRNIPVMIWEGRFHFYEGHHPWHIVLPIRLAISLGVNHFFITNAAGGIRDDIKTGDLMIIEDHLNLMGMNPLTGINLDRFGDRFPAMRDAYDHNFINAYQQLAVNRGIHLKKGVYAALPGPTYETPSEIKMLKYLGADAVGMSTVPEVIAIRHAHRRVMALSLITNETLAAAPPCHDEVIQVANEKKADVHSLILDLIKENP